MTIKKLRSIRYADVIVIGCLVAVLFSKPPVLVENLATLVILPLAILFFSITATISIKEKRVEHWSGTITITDHKIMYYMFIALYLIITLALLIALANVSIEFVHGKASLMK